MSHAYHALSAVINEYYAQYILQSFGIESGH